MDTLTANNIKCTVTHVLFSRDGFAICDCSTKDDIPGNSIRDVELRSGAKHFVALGSGMSTQLGQKLMLSGTWESNAKYKCMQLRIHDCVDYVGTSRHEIVSYLSSSILKGIGAKTAGLIYDAFGKDAIKIIEDDPQRLLEIPGIKEKKLEKIIDSFETHREFHNLTMLLAKYNVSYRTIVRIQRALGAGAVKKIKNNPYVLCRVHGFGFKTTDALALEMGVPGDSQFRIEGAITYALDDAQNAGHVFLTRQQLLNACCARDVLNSASANTEIEPSQVNEVLDLMLAKQILSKAQLKAVVFPYEDEPIYRNTAYTHEVVAATRIAAKLSIVQTPRKDWPAIVSETAEKLGVSLDEKQAEAAVMGLSNPLSVITGGPGTGKTTSLNVIVQSYLRLYPKNTIALAAPTGRAARRMSEQTHMDASTLHSLLSLQPDTWTDFDMAPSAEDMVKADLLIVDESSMIDAHLMAELMYRLKNKTQVIFLGDADQLPSVGAGNVLSQLLMTESIPHVRLEKIFRQAEDSVIPVNAANIRQGIQDLQFNKYFRLIRCETEDEGAEIIRKLVERSLERDMFSMTQILCPMKKRGGTCTGNLNTVLHDIVNPPAPDKAEATVANILFRVGDKVMQTRNIDGASNGDIGCITSISGDVSDPDDFSITVAFDSSDTPITYSYEGALDLVHALAITIHKSQGSEFDAVIIPIFRSMTFFLHRNLIYTAVTRAKKQVILVSDGIGVESAIRREDTSRRNTLLSKYILDFVEPSACQPSEVSA